MLYYVNNAIYINKLCKEKSCKNEQIKIFA